MSTLHVTQIRAALTRLLDGKIDISDLPSKADAAARDDAFATRSLAAFAVALSAGVPPESVAPYVVDGFGDNGLDVIYFEPDDKRLFLAQAKFSKRGDSGVQLGDSLKFLAGVRDIMNMEFSRFTSKRVLALRNMRVLPVGVHELWRRCGVAWAGHPRHDRSPLGTQQEPTS